MTIRLKWHMKMARNSSTKNNLEITSLKNNAKLYNEGLFWSTNCQKRFKVLKTHIVNKIGEKIYWHGNT